MMTVCISNPPYNMRWTIPEDAAEQNRFKGCVPPASNANYAFILTALEESDRCIFLLPNGVLSGGTKEEKEIRKKLVEKNKIDAVVMLPGNMFESTGIGTCILVLDNQKKNSDIEMVDLRDQCAEEEREQCGQYGGASHEKRVYKKKVKVVPDDVIEQAAGWIESRTSEAGKAKAVRVEEVAGNEYNLSPSRYIDLPEMKQEHRAYKDITKDINRIIGEKNKLRLTINEFLGKKIGLTKEMVKQENDMDELNELLEKLGAEKIVKDDYFRTSKVKNEIKFENGSKDQVSSILAMIFQMWKQHIYYLNEEENRLLAELRDALLPDLMSGKIEV